VKPELKDRLEVVLKPAAALADTVIELADKEIVKASPITYPSAEYFRRYTEAIDAQFKLNETVLELLNDELLAKMAELRGRQLTYSWISLGLAVIGTLLGVVISRSVTRPVGHLMGVMQRLTEGDNEARAKLDSPDEIGQLARRFDGMVDEREAASAKIGRENEQLNASVLNLLQAVAQLAQKNLTVSVPVAEDITGMRLRQFLLYGLEAVRGEWSLVTMAWNIRRMAVLKG
jgi:methyl-accepting chemotaxis protein